MFGWTKIFTFVALAAAMAIVTGGAGATSTSTLAGGTGATSRSTLAPATVSHTATAGKVSTAASRPGTLLKTPNLSTRSRVVRYLRAIGLDPRGVTIQRGARNYAGPNCPGTGWTCTSTAHPVVQIAVAGGKNVFLCTTGSCAVVQATSATATSTSRSLTAATATNTAKCIKTTGLSQSCSINQNNASANNEAIVYESTAKMSGLTQTASATAQITQQATGSNTNKACVLQNIDVDGSTVAKKGISVTVALEAHQSISITQDSATGGNALASATSAGTCTGDRLMQTQTLTSKASGSGPITQNQNASSGGPNVLLDIKQNQSAGFLGVASGFNTAKFTQNNTLTAVASTPAGPVNQTQSSAVGGIQATVNQFSTSPSTIDAVQSETQCEDALTSGSLICGTTLDTLPYSLTQVQYGPVRKGGGPSTQGNNSGDVFNVAQSSTQNNDTGQGQTNTVQGDCSTSGNCTVTQTTNVDGQTTTNTQSGQNVTTNITCTGTTCTKPTFNIKIVGNNAAFGGGPIQTYDFNTGALVNSFVPDGATIGTNNGRAVLVVGNEVFYTELCCGGSGATDFIRVAPFNGGAGGADIRTLPNPSSSGVQDLAFAGGALYALTGYPGGPLQVFKLDPTSGAVLGGPVPIAGSGQEASADGFAILPNGNFLINLSDTSCSYNQHDPTTGTATGVTLTVPSATRCTGVATDGTSLYFQTDFNSFTQTDLAGNFIAKKTVQGNTVEGISLVGG